MATHAFGMPTGKLKRILALTKIMETQEEVLNELIDRRGIQRTWRPYCRTETQKEAFAYSTALLNVEITVVTQKVEKTKARLKKLPSICSHCRGKRIIPTGRMTDITCGVCQGDGYMNGPNQLEFERRLSEIIQPSQA